VSGPNTTTTPDHQGDLFKDAAARRTDPSTSHVAAALANTTRLEHVVTSLLDGHPKGMTTHELAEASGLDLVSISPRIRPLVRKNRVIDSGAKREGRSGRMSIVWMLTPEEVA